MTTQFSEGAEPVYPPDTGLEPTHLDIALEIDIDGRTASGTVTTTVQPRREGARHLELDALDFQDVGVADPDGHPLAWSYDGTKIRIDWTDAPNDGESRRVAVTYRVTRPRSGLMFSAPDDAYPDAPRFAATDHETERARYWLPCVDLPTVRTTLDLHLRAKEAHTILANGVLDREESHGDGTKTAHWRLADVRCPSYLVCFVLGDLVRHDDGEFEGIPVAYFGVPPFTEAHLRRTFGRTKDLLAWMTDKLGMAFPFPKYFQFAVPGIGGAMENISLVSWDDLFVLDESLATELGELVVNINAHEMAHSYFGDLLVCRDFAHAWLKESWATFMEQCWLEDSMGEDDGRYELYSNAEAYFEEADTKYMRPIVTRRFHSSWEMFDRHLYPGGAARLHMLRAELGQDTFWAGVRAYLEANAGGVVETGDFRRALEGASGRSLGRFFDQWFMQPGYPKLKVGFSFDAAAKTGRFEIEQTQVDKEQGVGVFHLSTDVGWRIDGEDHSMPVTITEAKQVVLVPMDTDPEMVRFDPKARIIARLELDPGEPRLVRQLEAAPDVLGRIHAARVLCKKATPSAVGAVAKRFASEPFWGVRNEMAKALGKAGTTDALEALVSALAAEPDPRVVATVATALGGYRDPKAARSLEDRLDKGLPPRATAAALKALGAQREDAPAERLLEAAARPGYQGFAQSAAFEALAETRRAEHLAPLCQSVRYGATAHKARPAAARAIGTLGAFLQRPDRARAVDALEGLLRDPIPQVRANAAVGLETLGARESVPALEAYRATLPAQDQVLLDRRLRSIRETPEPKAAALEKEVESLRDDQRKLKDRLAELEARLAAKASGA